MNSKTLTTNADIGRALLWCMIHPPEKRPRLEITTNRGVFYLVTIEEPVLHTIQDSELTFAFFFGTSPLGRTQAFMWPSAGAEEPALGIIELGIYGQ